jgi:hypothetical protein
MKEQQHAFFLLLLEVARSLGRFKLKEEETAILRKTEFFLLL